MSATKPTPEIEAGWFLTALSARLLTFSHIAYGIAEGGEEARLRDAWVLSDLLKESAEAAEKMGNAIDLATMARTRAAPEAAL